MTHTCNVRSSWCCIQEISDDLGRHRSDAQVNNAPVTVLRGHEEGTTQWKHLQPGDLVKVCSFALKEPPPPSITPNGLPPVDCLQWVAPNDQEFESDPYQWQLHTVCLAPMHLHIIQHKKHSSSGWQFGKLSKLVCLCLHAKHVASDMSPHT